MVLPINPQRQNIEDLLDRGDMTFTQIANHVGVTKGVVAGISARLRERRKLHG